MNKRISILAILICVLCLTISTISFGQYIPNAPFKPQYPPAPDFVLKDIQGKTFRMSAQKGKPVLIFFGTTWCPGCRAEIPIYKKVYETHKTRGLEIIYINIMEPAKKVTRFAQSNALPFRVLLDEDGTVANQYNIIGVPMMLLVDKDGNIIKVGHSSSEMPLDKVIPVK